MPIDLIEALETGLQRSENVLEYYDWVRENYPKHEREYNDSIVHASDYSVALEGEDKKCHRQLWLRLRGKEKKEKTLGERIMHDHGFRIQERFTYLILMGLPSNWQLIEFLFEHGEDAESDIILKGPPGEVIVEIKTQRGKAFEYLPHTGAKQSHVLQCQTYMKKRDANFGLILYIDREGQNRPLQFPVSRDDEAVDRGQQVAESIYNMGKEPETIQQLHVRIRKNKSSDDAVYIDLPWQCRYCDFFEVSCEGTIPPDAVQNKGIIGRIQPNGDFYSDEYPQFEELWKSYIYNSKAYRDLVEEGRYDKVGYDTLKEET